MSLSKELQIRVKEWIKKLSAVIDNIHWRRNRNLYAKVLLGMVRRKIMEHPFNRMPG